MIQDLLTGIGLSVYAGLQELGRLFVLFFQTLRSLFERPIRPRTFVDQMEFIGVKSTFIVGLTSLFSGMVFALQSSYAFRLFGAEALIGPTVALSLVRELGPVFTAIMVTARAGAAMATELGTMRVTEQVDALYTMGINPVQYLVLPRIVASIIMVPALAGIFSYIGFLGSYVVTTEVVGVGPNVFIRDVVDMLTFADIYKGLIKASVFGLLLSLISCDQGYNANGGARGVGIATTQAVVRSCITILVSDYFLTDWLYG